MMLAPDSDTRKTTDLHIQSHVHYHSPMWYAKPYRDAVGLQRLITNSAPDAEAKDLAALAKSFVALEMLKLRIKMRPAPKPIDVAKDQSSRRKQSRGRAVAVEA